MDQVIEQTEGEREGYGAFFGNYPDKEQIENYYIVEAVKGKSVCQYIAQRHDSREPEV
jgi:hypothetical protein